jgi:hypothetical protein
MPRSRRIRIVFAALAVVFFATPLALRAVGIKAKAFENRRFALAPRLSDGWSFFDETTRFLIDRMPLRYEAVRANTWIDNNIFHTVPVYGLNGLGGVASDQALPFTGAPRQDTAGLTAGAAAGHSTKNKAQPPATAAQIAAGRDGWLFLQGVFNRACAPFMPFAQAASRWEALLRVIRASGRRAELAVPPDKSTIYPEYVSPGILDYSCGLAGTAALWRVLESPSAVRAGIVGLRKALLAAKRSSGVLLYYKLDSHWNSAGSLIFVQSALPPLSRTVRVLPTDVVTGAPGPHPGDLMGLLGQSGTEIAPSRSVNRAPGATVIPGNTVLVGDSYADVSMFELTPYFHSISLQEWVNNPPQQIADAIAASRNVILETVEREFDYRATDAAYITPKFIALVRATLARHPLAGH